MLNVVLQSGGALDKLAAFLHPQSTSSEESLFYRLQKKRNHLEHLLSARWTCSFIPGLINMHEQLSHMFYLLKICKSFGHFWHFGCPWTKPGVLCARKLQFATVFLHFLHISTELSLPVITVAAVWWPGVCVWKTYCWYHNMSFYLLYLKQYEVSHITSAQHFITWPPHSSAHDLE